MIRLWIAAALLLGTIAGAYAQFNGCAPGLCPSSIFGRGFRPQSGSGVPPPTPCVSTGVFDLSNVCNDIYFIGALR